MSEIMHFGIKYRSGRYPYGSGENPFQHDPRGAINGFLAAYKQAIIDGKSDSDFAQEQGLTPSQLVTMKRICKNAERRERVAQVKQMQEDGLSNSEIGRQLGINESTVRSLLNPLREYNSERGEKTAELIAERIKEKGMLDVGKGVEAELGVSRDTLEEALLTLNIQGYNVYPVGVAQLTNKGNQTITTVITPPDEKYTYSYVYNNIGDVKSLSDYHSDDGGMTFRSFQPPESLDSSRIQIRYAEEGGVDKDGVIELRRGVDDISLGNSNYAQVRIAVDGTHYLKGMAVYSDDMPDGVDVIFNTNKSVGTPQEKVFKEMKTNPDGSVNLDNPFGATIKEAGGQSYWTDSNGEQHLRVINKVKEEGDWDNYKDTLSSQFLSKQPESLIRKQLGLSYAEAADEYDKICNLTNPTVKKNMLETFANECDSSAVHLRAAALPRQNWQVILPVTSMKDDEIFAPNYKNGETVALVRYPHGSITEIPILKVNNNQKEGKSVVGTALDAVGINKNVADQLSGADFDGDTVLVIPLSSKVHITNARQYDSVKGFDPKATYATTESVDKNGNKIYLNADGKKIQTMSKANTQKQMGSVSNLITDMTLKGASEEDIAPALRHSMVVIDAEKHHLDYKQSEKDNNIAELKNKWQGHYSEDGHWSTGASTLISMAKSDYSVPETQGTPRIDPDTGKLVYKQSGREYAVVKDPTTKKDVAGTIKSDGVYYKNSDGKSVKVTNETVTYKPAQSKTTKMAATDDAYTLSSGTRKENVYAEYANSMKALANQARLEKLNTGNLHVDPQAKSTYASEVESLMDKLVTAQANAPKERVAQRMATTAVKEKTQGMDLSAKEESKIKTAELNKARAQVGAKRTGIDITDREWEAIQNGAISENKLQAILTYTDTDTIRKLATPRQSATLSNTEINRIRSYNASGYTISDIAEALGRSESTIRKYLKES